MLQALLVARDRKNALGNAFDCRGERLSAGFEVLGDDVLFRPMTRLDAEGLLDALDGEQCLNGLAFGVGTRRFDLLDGCVGVRDTDARDDAGSDGQFGPPPFAVVSHPHSIRSIVDNLSALRSDYT